MYSFYKDHGVKLVDFVGWLLPVQFTSIKEEHEAVRTNAGLFDVSHMGEISVTGSGALDFLQKMMTNDVSKLKSGAALYTAMCYEDGGTVDDLIVYKRGEEDYLLVVNAANTDSDVDWLSSHRSGDVTIENRSDDIAQLAVQGPKAEQILQTLTSTDLSQIPFFKFKDEVPIASATVIISRTGYTGEDGFELYCAWQEAPRLWEAILDAGRAFGLVPCGLGARDTLRFEATLPLYGQELSADITPVEAGIGFAVKTDKTVEFIGKEVLKNQKEQGPSRKLVGIEMLERGIPRTGYRVVANGEVIGKVTSGTQSPTLKKNVGLAIVDHRYTTIGTDVTVEVRGKCLKAKVVKTPFYKR